MKDDRVDRHDSWIAMVNAQVIPIYRWIYAQVGNREQAEALTTRVFDEAVREPGGRTPCAPTPQAARERVFQIARAVVAGELRAFYGASAEAALDRLNRGVEREDRERMTSENNLGRTNLPAARAHALLARLPARECEVLTCRFLLGYPIERTAAQLHLSVAETMALQFVALGHASQLNATTPVEVQGQEQGQEHKPELEPEPAQRVLEGCGCH